MIISGNLRWKALFLDLDGTLIGGDYKVSERTVCALRRAADAGVALCANTGRPLAETMPVLGHLPEFQYAVTCNGAMVSRLRDGACLASRQMPEASCREVLRLLREYKCFSQVYLGAEFYSDETAYRALEELPELRPYMEATGHMAGRVDDYAALLAQKGQAPNKVYLIAQAERVDQLRRSLSALDGLYVTSSGTNNLEVVPVGVDKGTGLQAVCADLGITAAEAMAIGDSYNDLEMLRAAGLGVAMGGSPEAVYQAADCVTGLCRLDGAAEAIERYLLNDERA